VVLQMANAYGDLQTAPVIGQFVSQVKERSGGNLRIQVANRWGDYADDAEQQVVRAVAAGKVDLGWAGARVFDTIGVTSFQALQAPMLIDNYALEQAEDHLWHPEVTRSGPGHPIARRDPDGDLPTLA
jgi:TRAP-type C4-dicarboxylate transport system substrate-binding protein